GCSYWEYRLSQRKAIEGDRFLVAANEPYVQDDCAGNVPAGAFIVYFGKSTTYISDATVTNADSSQPLLLTANLPVLTIDRTSKHTIVVSDSEMFIPALDQHIQRMCIGPINGGYRF